MPRAPKTSFVISRIKRHQHRFDLKSGFAARDGGWFDLKPGAFARKEGRLDFKSGVFACKGGWFDFKSGVFAGKRGRFDLKSGVFAGSGVHLEMLFCWMVAQFGRNRRPDAPPAPATGAFAFEGEREWLERLS